MKQKYRYEIILDYLKDHKRITSVEIIKLSGSCYPASIIKQIRGHGHEIMNEPSGSYWDTFIYVEPGQMELSL